MGRRKRIVDKTPELDLHGVKHADVPTTVEDFVLTQKTTSVKIITGNSGTMKKIVKQTLEKHGFKYLDFFPAYILAS